MSEHRLQQQILAAIGSEPGVLVWRQNVGKAPSAWQVLPRALAVWLRSSMGELAVGPLYISSGRLVSYGTVGQADILCVCRGRLLAIEVKTATGRQSLAQLAWRRALEAAGGVYVVARSVDDAVAALRGMR
jgi:hypothetical protein